MHRLKIKGWRKIYQANREQRKAGVAILVCDKTDFIPTRVHRYIKQVLNDLQRDLDSYTITVGDFNTPLSILDRSMRQKINKDIQDLNSDMDQANLVEIYRTLHPTSTEYTFFSALHFTYSKIDHIIGSK